MDTPWTRARYLILDTETTGLKPEENHRVVELAAHSVDLATGTATLVFDQLVHPERSIPPEASAIHHLVDADVAHAPPLEVVWADFVPILAQHDAIVAHHAAFDRAFLPATAVPWICTLRLARHLWPEAPRHTNQVLRYWLGLTVDAPRPHRAVDDTCVTAAVFQAMVPWLNRLPDLGTPQDPMGPQEMGGSRSAVERASGPKRHSTECATGLRTGLSGGEASAIALASASVQKPEGVGRAPAKYYNDAWKGGRAA